MRKSIFQAIYTVLMGLFIYSCSGLTLPEQIGVKGTLNLPIRVGAADLNKTLREKIEEVFSANEQEDTKVYTVNYEGQTVQTFCIYIPIEMTEDLNPNSFLKTIDKQINDNIDTEPKEIDVQNLIYPGFPIPISEINLFNDDNKIRPVSLNDIAGYVRTIVFDKSSGIGLNFHFDKIPDGLKMKVECKEVNTKGQPISPTPLFSTTKPLCKGEDIKFGNDQPVTLQVSKYQDDARMLSFSIELQSADGSGSWSLDNFSFGEKIEIKGKMSFFHVWTNAEIDLAKALKASAEINNTYGKFPAGAFDLSRLRNYFDGGFDINGLEVNIYMDGPVVNYFESKLLLMAQYDDEIGNKRERLYNEPLFINKEPIKIDRYLDKNGFYNNQNLPDNTSGYDGKIYDDTIANIFKATPNNLSFIFTIEAEEGQYLIITPEAFNDIDNSGAIRTTMMIMLPMVLKATGDNNEKSSIYLPNMFGEKDDLFGRKEPKELFSKGKIDYIRLTIDFSNPIFTGGCLFINEKKELFPDGVRLDGKKIELNFTKEQLDIIEENLIVPRIKIEIDDDGMISVPKDMAIMSIRLEMKGLINIGEH